MQVWLHLAMYVCARGLHACLEQLRAGARSTGDQNEADEGLEERNPAAKECREAAEVPASPG
jgi:hypothetical protein